MDIHSLGFQTDLMVAQASGSEVVDAGDHVVVRTPSEPTYHWGNHLLLPATADAEDAERWLATFDLVFPDADHVAIGIDATQAPAVDLSGYEANGLHVTVERVQAVRVADLVQPVEPLPAGTEIRPLRTDADWAAHLDLRIVVNAAEGAMRDFLAGHARNCRRLVGAGAGTWLGLWAEGGLQASLGLVSDAANARYQMVETHPEWRRRGAAGWLVHTAGRQSGAKRLVIVAEINGPAIALYRRLGFADTEDQVKVSA